MNRRIVIFAITLAALAFAIGGIWRAFQRDRQAREYLATARKHAISLEAEIRGSERQLTEDRVKLQSIEAQLAQSKKIQHSVGHSELSVAAALRRDPDLRALYLKQSETTHRAHLTPFFQSLRLSAPQIDSIIEAMTARDGRSLDIRTSAETQGLSVQDPAISASLKASEDGLEVFLQNTLGDQDYHRLIDFTRTEDVRSLVAQVAGSAAAGVAPISSDQGVQLTQLLANFSGSYQRGENANVETIDWKAAMVQAQGMLSEPQLNRLQTAVTMKETGQILQQLHSMASQAQ